jgi:hypothetical protein
MDRFLGDPQRGAVAWQNTMTETTFRSVSEQFLLFGKASTTFVHCSCEGSALADEEIFEDHHLKPKVLTLSSFNDLKLDGLFIVPL